MVVNIDGCEGGDVDLVGQLFGYIRKDARIEGVEPFDHQHGVFLQFEFIAAEDTLTLVKIIGRQADLLAVHQIVHLLAEERQIDGIDILEVILSVLVFGRIHAVDEIVIHREHFGTDTVDQQLDLETFGESGLTGRRSTGDKDDLRPFLGNGIGYLGDLLLVQGLG